MSPSSDITHFHLLFPHEFARKVFLSFLFLFSLTRETSNLWHVWCQVMLHCFTLEKLLFHKNWVLISHVVECLSYWQKVLRRHDTIHQTGMILHEGKGTIMCYKLILNIDTYSHHNNLNVLMGLLAGGNQLCKKKLFCVYFENWSCNRTRFQNGLTSTTAVFSPCELPLPGYKCISKNTERAMIKPTIKRQSLEYIRITLLRNNSMIMNCFRDIKTLQ